jgi:hypothetical protein
MMISRRVRSGRTSTPTAGCGVPINYHMLADFRVAHRWALDELLTCILSTLLSVGLVNQPPPCGPGRAPGAG